MVVDTHRLLVDRYRLIDPIGAGGMSVVWRAQDEVLGRSVAVKVLAAPYAADRGFRERIRAEAKAVALLTHPNVAAVYDYGEAVGPGDPEPFVVMELVDGVPLTDRMRAGPLPWRLATEICAEVAAALSAAHAHGLVHRDITPANIMVTPTGAKVVDFGIAAVVGEREAATPQGTIVGTPAYLAPERLAGDPGGPASDVYALGLVLYQALAGGLPWSASTKTEMLRAHRYQEPESLPPIPGLPIEIASACHRCLNKDPAARPASPDLARALARRVRLRVAVVDPPSTDEVVEPAPVAVTHLPADPLLSTQPAGPSGGTRVLAADDEPLRDGTRVAGFAAVEGEPSEAADPARQPLPAKWLVGIWAVTGVLVIGLIAGIVAIATPTGSPARSDGLAAPFGTAAGATPADSSPPATTPLPTATTPSPATTSGPPSGTLTSCTVRYNVTSQWQDGATVQLSITNTGNVNVNGWILTFELRGDQRTTGGWNGEWSQQGSTVTVRNADYNAVLAPGQPVSDVGSNLAGRFGRRGNEPDRFTVNGVRCRSD